MDNIIAIREKSSEKADVAFKDFMSLLEKEMNERAIKTPGRYCGSLGKDLERDTLATMKDIAPQTPFNPNNIELVSGQRFPDIIAESYYGVEVKSTKENHWTSTGSSIVESTRVPNVERIYMLFGKLGGERAEFKCRPYEDCLYDIAVTHSPRYLIDMKLEKSQTIFSKMGISYDTLRTSDDAINTVRKYYRDKAKAENRAEMPWWLGESNYGNTVKMSVRLWGGKSYKEENRRLQAKMFILFPEVLNSEYSNIALWLCVRYSIVLYNARDLFSASGVMTKIDGCNLKFDLPHIVGSILEFSDLIKAYLSQPDEIMYSELADYRPELLKAVNLYDAWLDDVDARVQKLKRKNGMTILQSGSIPFKDWFNNGSKLTTK